ncbi:M35 family metallo-endopeptidase [Tahibacter harae]|uniref:M35 family metallo-endopeptidase n=1 Tax=Tahibacter harae TaxID=2963937 RepID=A0ABT1QNY9_9GAMM|nr:M35 family metallo-endopeptidase [Tahibacter harae]MCQ4163515.1 M35 family metallo-endopeptidase [Tahibacter harae]
MYRILAGMVALGFLGSASAAGLDVALSGPLAKSDYGSGKIHYALTNHTGRTLHVLRWQTPLDGLSGELFQVTKNGEPVAYEGILAMRTAPTAADYVELAPGATLAAEIDLTAYYDMKAGGQYEVRYARDARDVIAEVAQSAKGGLDVGYLDFDRAAATSIHVDTAVDAFDAPALKAGPGLLAATNSYESCSTTQKNAMPAARTQATSYANSSRNYLNAGSTGTRYTWWFGAYNASRYSTVRSNFTRIYNALSSQPFVFNCTCPAAPSAIAYVYPNQPYRIHLCSSYWGYPNAGAPYSKGSILVHEVSHFDVVANTDDVTYGTTNSHNLALSNPASAARNADNYHYFANNANNGN